MDALLQRKFPSGKPRWVPPNINQKMGDFRKIRNDISLRVVSSLDANHRTNTSTERPSFWVSRAEDASLHIPLHNRARFEITAEDLEEFLFVQDVNALGFSNLIHLDHESDHVLSKELVVLKQRDLSAKLPPLVELVGDLANKFLLYEILQRFPCQ